MRSETKKSLTSFALQVVIYAGLVAAYMFLVLHFLGEWIWQINRKDLQIYAFLSLFLIVAQGMLLEAVTSALLSMVEKFRAPRDET